MEWDRDYKREDRKRIAFCFLFWIMWITNKTCWQIFYPLKMQWLLGYFFLRKHWCIREDTYRAKHHWRAIPTFETWQSRLPLVNFYIEGSACCLVGLSATCAVTLRRLYEAGSLKVGELRLASMPWLVGSGTPAGQAAATAAGFNFLFLLTPSCWRGL